MNRLVAFLVLLAVSMTTSLVRAQESSTASRTASVASSSPGRVAALNVAEAAEMAEALMTSVAAAKGTEAGADPQGLPMAWERALASADSAGEQVAAHIGQSARVTGARFRDWLPSAAQLEQLIHRSLAREGVDVFSDARFDVAAIAGLASAIATVCQDLECTISALATGFQETRWRPHLRGPAGECGFAQQTPRYADDIPELASLTNRERCELLVGDPLIAVRQWHAKREQKIERHGLQRWPCYYNAGYICTPQGQHYLFMHQRYRRLYEGLLEQERGLGESLVFGG